MAIDLNGARCILTFFPVIRDDTRLTDESKLILRLDDGGLKSIDIPRQNILHYFPISEWLRYDTVAVLQVFHYKKVEECFDGGLMDSRQFR